MLLFFTIMIIILIIMLARPSSRGHVVNTFPTSFFNGALQVALAVGGVDLGRPGQFAGAGQEEQLLVSFTVVGIGFVFERSVHQGTSSCMNVCHCGPRSESRAAAAV